MKDNNDTRNAFIVGGIAALFLLAIAIGCWHQPGFRFGIGLPPEVVEKPVIVSAAETRKARLDHIEDRINDKIRFAAEDGDYGIVLTDLDSLTSQDLADIGNLLEAQGYHIKFSNKNNRVVKLRIDWVK